MRVSTYVTLSALLGAAWMIWVTMTLLDVRARSWQSDVPPRSAFWQSEPAPAYVLQGSAGASVSSFVDPRVWAKGTLAIRRTDKGWQAEEAVCRSTKPFLKTTFKSSAGDTPIFIHDLAIDGISRSLKDTGKWEPELEAAYMQCVGNDKDLVFVDIGANIGVYSLALLKSGRRVIAFEPLADNAERLCRSVQEGGLAELFTLVYNAVSDRRQVMEIVRDPVSKGGTYVRDGGQGGARGEVIYSILLDDILDVFPNLTKAVVKIDVERHEARALAHGHRFFQQVDVPCMMMEWERHHRSPDGFRLMLEMAEYGLLPYDPKNMGRSLDTDKFGQWPANVIWRKVRNYGPNTQ